MAVGLMQQSPNLCDREGANKLDTEPAKALTPFSRGVFLENGGRAYAAESQFMRPGGSE